MGVGTVTEKVYTESQHRSQVVVVVNSEAQDALKDQSRRASRKKRWGAELAGGRLEDKGWEGRVFSWREQHE